jgi:hypothetical protein
MWDQRRLTVLPVTKDSSGANRLTAQCGSATEA